MAYKLLVSSAGNLMTSQFSGSLLVHDDAGDVVMPCGPCCSPCPYGNNTLAYISGYDDSTFGACEDCQDGGSNEWNSYMKSGASAGGMPCYLQKNYNTDSSGLTSLPYFDATHKMALADITAEQWDSGAGEWVPLYYEDGGWQKLAPDGDCRFVFRLYCEGSVEPYVLVYEAAKLVGRGVSGDYDDTGTGCGTGPATITITLDSLDGGAVPACGG